MFTTIFITFVLAIITFNINHRIKRFIDIKLCINSLFDLYGNPTAFITNDLGAINNLLSSEIMYIEKLHDFNKCVIPHLAKLRELRLLYYSYSKRPEQKISLPVIKSELRSIGFKKLGPGFVLFAFFNLNFSVYE